MQVAKLNLVIQLRHPLQRWIKILMMFIPKYLIGVPRINRLQAIDSFDAELNLLRCITISKRTMDKAEKQGTLSDQQLGRINN